MQVDRINICVTPKKLVHAYGMQIIYKMDSNTVRNIYVFAESGEVNNVRHKVTKVVFRFAVDIYH